MRLVIFFLLFQLSLSVFAQQTGDSILKEVISAAPNDFKKYRSSVGRGSPELLRYASLVTIEGTKNNYISHTISTDVYTAEIADSLKWSKGWKLLKRWKRKMEAILDTAFILKKRPFFRFNFSDEEFTFENKETTVSVSICLVHRDRNKRPYELMLFISQD